MPVKSPSVSYDAKGNPWAVPFLSEWNGEKVSLKVFPPKRNWSRPSPEAHVASPGKEETGSHGCEPSGAAPVAVSSSWLAHCPLAPLAVCVPGPQRLL